MSSNTHLPSSSQVASTTGADSDNVDSYKGYDKVMKEQGPAKGAKYRDMTTEQRFQYRFAIPPPPDKRLLTQAGMKINVGDYTWNVHEDLVWSESTYIRDSLKADSKDNSIDLSEHKPELIARMVLFCYYEQYPIGPNFLVVPSAKTVAQVMSENRTSEASSLNALTEPKFDSVLHLQMYVLGNQLGMRYLTKHAQKKFKKSLAIDGEAFWACVEMLENIKDDEIAEKVDSRIRHAVENRVFSTRRPFRDLGEVNVGMAMKISDLGKSRFGQP